jgi:hypothetical protein
LDKKRPVYKRTCSISADGGSSTMTVFCFHWHFSKMCSGWWLGPKFGSQEEVYGHCPTASSAPPVKGWQIRSHGRRQHDPARFTAGSVDAPAAMLPSVEEAIASLDVRTLMGSVRARSQGAAAYFAHFNCLLHLEYLTEVTALRRRFTSRDGIALQKLGWCLTGLPVSHISVSTRSRRSSRGATDGEPTSCKVTLKLDGKVSFDRLRLKRGDSIILSETDPLRDKVADGSLVRSFYEQPRGLFLLRQLSSGGFAIRKLTVFLAAGSRAWRRSCCSRGDFPSSGLQHENVRRFWTDAFLEWAQLLSARRFMTCL